MPTTRRRAKAKVRVPAGMGCAGGLRARSMSTTAPPLGAVSARPPPFDWRNIARRGQFHKMEENALAKICEQVLIHRALWRFSPGIVAGPDPHWQLPCKRPVWRDRPWSRSALPAAFAQVGLASPEACREPE